MNKSFSARLAALEAEQVDAAPIEQPRIVPAFDTVLAGLDSVLDAIDRGWGEPKRRSEAQKWLYISVPGEEGRRAFRCWCDLLNEYVAPMDDERPRTSDEYAAFLREQRRVIAFLASRMDAEIEMLAGMDGDPLFWTPEQQALAAEWERLVNEAL